MRKSNRPQQQQSAGAPACVGPDIEQIVGIALASSSVLAASTERTLDLRRTSLTRSPVLQLPYAIVLTDADRGAVWCPGVHAAITF